ncbi:hypothetical protein [Myxococcus sp. RHSTA-1-4]|uniref:hypothetical protein n=1 Tax=Myxococcus sp. RHSTA-1-4 TaxID=2874601 RepID=UPI001CC1AC9C|nr:hypothetical protein [Myxococcus sp. RHSTA-1-4]MBZ4422362.1 hypothetical protein [Myxococcus sp. RHSTA-1-4]
MPLNLAQRRTLNNFKTTPYVSGFQGLVRGITNTEVEVEVDWTSVENTTDPDWVLRDECKYVKEYFFSHLENALKKVCADDFGKDAFKAKIKKVTIANSERDDVPFVEGNIKLLDGTLAILTSLRGNVYIGEGMIQEFLEQNL